MLPRLKLQNTQEPTTWHGIDGRFTSHYISKFYQDNSMKKANNTTKAHTDFFEKEHFYNQEIAKIERNKHVLKNISKEKEKFDKIRKRVLTEKQFIEKKYKHAAIVIQKHIRGYLCRRRHEGELEDLKTAKLGISMKSMRRYVGQCCIYLADNIVEASIIIQKHIRRYQAMKLLKDMKIKNQASKIITGFLRAVKNRSKFHKSMEVLRWKKNLKDFKKRVKWNKFRTWWKAHRLQFNVIKNKMRSRNSSLHRKTPSRSRVGSIDEPRSRRSSTLHIPKFNVIHEENAGKKKHSINENEIISQGNNEDDKRFLDAPGDKHGFDKIDEMGIEESLTITMDLPNKNSQVNDPIVVVDVVKVPEEEKMNENAREDDEDLGFNDEDYIGDDEEMEELEEDMDNDIEVTGIQEENENEIVEIDEENQVVAENNEKSMKKKDEKTEEPIPSHRRPTAAYNSWKKRPPSPEELRKEIFPPPRRLLVWTKCRKVYKSQTKKYKKKIPLWKPPLTANDMNMRKLPKVAVKKRLRIPDFLEPYTLIAPSETPESPIKLNEDEENEEFSINSDTSYEYEPVDYKSTGLSVALPQLYSIVKSYGKNADLLMRGMKK
ncbi:hypothetical protein SteCoe_34197 [Stentor coeruleus]|uniref:Uncharacterized protein n=1 Tax=Stentor coeruleus TaxID=5963 RepID=A0A1R2AV15_9CILI|nr:hypothetical protein SteCoe_34197 [Stentor coeruleus]